MKMMILPVHSTVRITRGVRRLAGLKGAGARQPIRERRGATAAAGVTFPTQGGEVERRWKGDGKEGGTGAGREKPRQ